MQGEGSWSEQNYFLFHPTMNALAMGTRTQGDVAYSMLKGTI
jgi:hypothetical protein